MRWVVVTFLALGCTAPVASQPTLAWHWLDAPPLQSRIQLLRAERVIGDYTLACIAAEEEDPEDPAAIALEVPAYGRPVVLVRCTSGAHTARLHLLDPRTDASEPVFSRAGSYVVGWGRRGDALWIEHDRPCHECDPPFETVGEIWPPAGS